MIRPLPFYPISLRALLFISTLLCLPFSSKAQFDRSDATVVYEPPNGPIATFDVDGDGDIDIFQLSKSADGDILFYENIDGLGTFAPPVHSGDTTWWNYPNTASHFLIADMDNDGDEDVVLRRRVHLNQPYFKNEGDGRFTNPVANTDSTQFTKRYRYDLGDFNGDGWEDIIIYRTQSEALSINYNHGVETGFVYQELDDVILPMDDNYRLEAMKTIDINTDGLDDIVFFYRHQIETSYELVLFPYINENGHLIGQEPSVIDSTLTRGSFFDVRHISVIDINLDDKPDYVLDLDGCFFVEDNNCTDNLLLLLENRNGNGQFKELARYRSVTSHQVADVNLDGQIDIIAQVGSYLPNSHIMALTYNGTPILSSSIIDSFNTPAINIVDFNQDGYPDLITNSRPFPSGTSLLTLYTNAANGEVAFNTPQYIDRFNFSTSNSVSRFSGTRFYDWDNDNDLDLLILGELNDSLASVFLLRNEDGLGRFSEPEFLFSIPYAPAIPIMPRFLSSDFNNDNQPDFFIVVVASEEDETYILNGLVGISDTSSNTYETILFEGINLNPLSFFGTEDIDHDGDIDLLMIEFDGSIAIAWNQLSESGGFELMPNFVNRPPLDDNESFVSFSYKDINDDGQKDLVCQSTRGHFYWALQLDGNGTYEAWKNLPGNPKFSVNVFSLYLENFDSDGNLDVLFTGPNAILCKYDRIEQTYNQLIPLNNHINYYSVPVDLNYDGTIDLYTRDGIQLSDPSTGYLSAPYLPIEDDQFFNFFLHQIVQIEDIDGDGQLEVLYGNNYYSPTGLYWYNLDFIPNTSLQGYIRYDTTASCTYDSLYQSMGAWSVLIDNDSFPQLATTNGEGYYGALLNDSLSYTIRPIPPSAYWQACPADTLLQAPLPQNINTLNFAAEAVVDCAILEVDLSASTISQCFNSTISINYLNIGTLPLPDAQIVLSFDTRFTPVTSSFPWETATDSTLTFLLNDVEIGGQGFFTVDFMPDCQNLNLHETVCFSTTVSPDSLCQDPFLEWDGASLVGASFCDGDSLAFTITNVGEGDMQLPQTFEISIISDDFVFFLIDQTGLGSGESDTIRLPLFNQAARLKMEQPPGHPLPEPINLAVESCISSPLDTSNVLSHFPIDQGNPFVNTLCATVVGPFDPNIKTALPLGFGSEHFIEKDWTIDYTIQFQNIGTAAALNVYLRDTLSPLLDLSTLKMKGASHPVELQLLPNRELYFLFNNINLPDSTSNEAGSNGFVSFSIAPVDGIAPLSVIKNRAGVYFDFNEVVLTDYVEHTIVKPQQASMVTEDVCIGNLYEGVQITKDTIIKELHSFPDRDSIIWHYVTARPKYIIDTTIILETPAIYNDVFVVSDTSFTSLLTTSFGCDSIITVTIDAITRSEDLRIASLVDIHPNPTSGFLQLSWATSPIIIERISIYTLEGKQFFEQEISSPTQAIKLDIRDFPSGIYLLELQTHQGVDWVRVTKN